MVAVSDSRTRLVRAGDVAHRFGERVGRCGDGRRHRGLGEGAAERSQPIEPGLEL